MLAQIGFGIIIRIPAGDGSIPFAVAILVGALALLAFMVVSITRLAKALDLSPLLYGLLMIVPCVSFFTLLSLSGKATNQLKAAGIKVGLLGADPNSI